MEDSNLELENYRTIKCTTVANIDDFGDSFQSQDSNLTFFYLNIRSYNKNFDLLLINLNTLRTKFDFIILGETWLGRGGEGDGRGEQLDGYKMFATGRGRNKSDGVLVYVNERVSVVEREVELGDVYGLSLDFTYNQRQCNVLAVYRTHDSDLDNLTTALRQYYSATDRGKTYVFLGDVNANILDTDNKTERYLDVMYEADFMCGIRQPTREVGDSRTCIDHIFVNHNDYTNVRTAVIQTDITDHYSVFVEVGFSLQKSTAICPETFIDKQMLGRLVDECDWTAVTEEPAPGASAAILLDTVQRCVQAATKTNNSTRPRLRKLKPWITNELVKAIRKRDKLSKTIKKQPFNPILTDYYHNYKRQLNNTIKQVKRQYYRSKLIGAKNSPKLFWRTVNEIAGRGTKKDIFPLDQFTASRQYSSDCDVRIQVADEFNDYYCKVGYNLAQAISSRGPPVVDDTDYTVDQHFSMTTITETQLCRYVQALRGGSAPGYDCISADFLKEHLSVLRKPLLHVINASIRSGEFPDAFKVAKVIPLYKSNDISLTSNFRPISLLSVFTKVLEKIIKDQLTLFLTEANVLTDRQYGFRKGTSITDAFFDLNRDINNAINKGNKILMIFLDLAKAFDSVDRTILLKKMEIIGITGKALNWFKSYLSNRSQFVSINGAKGCVKPVDYGVVQGSTLGPLLFLIYVNNLSKINMFGKLFLFADDTAVFFEGKNWDIVHQSALRDLSLLKNWFNQNRLTLNVSKTKFMPISLRNRGNTLINSLKLHDCGDVNNRNCACEGIGRVDSYKYLGVIFDSKLTWSEHILFLNNKLRKLIFAFRQLSLHLNPDEIKMAYSAYAQSLLEGGIISWGGAYKSILEPLQVTQKLIIKAALGRGRRYSSDAVFNDMQVLNIRQLYVRTLVIHIYKHFHDIFEATGHDYATRAALTGDIQTPRLVRTFSVTNCYYSAHFIYRKLPEYLREFDSCTIATYKSRVNNWLYELGRESTEHLLTSDYRNG